ncbi:MAG: hypothetical protein AAGF31_01830 [Planctomycetota bacterium]
MWCRHCQQDVPAVAQGADERVQCARCQRPLGATPFAAPVSDSGVPLKPAVEVEPWSAADVLGAEDEQRIRQLGQQLRTARRVGSQANPAGRKLRFDTPASATGVDAAPARPSIDPAVTPAPRAPSKPSQASAWMVALLGALTLGIGLGLLAWSLFGERPDLWNWGLAATLSGQGLLIVGLLQLLATLWSAGRDATNRLITLHYELRRLQRTADSIAGGRNATPSAFYADLTRGSSPQVMLANLKGQVDELTARFSAE